MSLPMGVGLDDDTLSTMSVEEQGFWRSFLSEAQSVIEKSGTSSNDGRLDPPTSLREKYTKAIGQYNGKRYCQVRQLEQIFNF